MQSKVLVLLVALTVAACTQVSAPETSYYQGERLTLEAEATPGLIDAAFKLKINGETVVDGRSQPFGGSSQTFQGSWQGKQVSVRATRVVQFFSEYTLLDVFISGELVDTLTV